MVTALSVAMLRAFAAARRCATVAAASARTVSTATRTTPAATTWRRTATPAAVTATTRAMAANGSANGSGKSRGPTPLPRLGGARRTALLGSGSGGGEIGFSALDSPPKVVPAIAYPRPLFPKFAVNMTFSSDSPVIDHIRANMGRGAFLGFFLRKAPAKAESKVAVDPANVVDASPNDGKASADGAAPSSSTAPPTAAPSTDTKEKKDGAEGDDVTYDSGDEKTARAMSRNLQHMLMKAQGGADEPGGEFTPKSVDHIHHIGMLARAIHIGEMQSGGFHVFLVGERRIQITGVESSNPTLSVFIEPCVEEPWPQPDQQGAETPQEALLRRNTVKAYMIELRARAEELVNHYQQNKLSSFPVMFLQPSELHANPYHLSDFAFEICRNADAEDLQQGLATLEVQQRLHLAVRLVSTELNVFRLANEVKAETHRKFQDRQERHILEEEWRTIGKKLGKLGKTDKDFIDKFKARLKDKTVPPEVMRVIDEEVTRLQTIEPAAMEFGVSRNYLDWLTIMPWGSFTKESYEVEKAEAILNRDHYGMKDVKDRILEFVSIGKLHGTVPPGKILCFVGPPGVGKTSIGKSIAAALGRKFYRFSVGGLYDVSEIKGHRRTYVGAMPGKLVQAFKNVGTSNPVILIDEIDKIGSGIRGDPSSALLEVLDPEQNSSFMDHYLDVPLDLSKVLFVCTANVLDTIPEPLRDRMDFIRLSGYVWQEKFHIAQHYLLPAERLKTGVTDKLAIVEPSAIRSLIRWYCREAGVRNLQKYVEKLLRKVALKVARGTAKDAPAVTITDANVTEYVGKPLYTSERMYDRPPPGVVMGLAWSANGGSTLYIESTVSDYYERVKSSEDAGAVVGGIGGGQGRLHRTGQMGAVMKESTDIAYTVAKHMLHKLDPQADFFRTRSIHLHVPEGATPKDGPSAGITMVTSLLSLAQDKQVKADLAMTGELTITGKVLPIGGVKEKVIAARLSNAKELIFPMNNRKDFDELADFIREGLTVHFVDWYQQVFDIAFGFTPDDKVITVVVPPMTDAVTLLETAKSPDAAATTSGAAAPAAPSSSTPAAVPPNT